MSRPTEIYKVETLKGNQELLSHTNDKVIDDLKLGRVEKRMVTTTDDKEMLV